MSLPRIIAVAFLCMTVGQEPAILPVVPTETQSFVRQALQDRLSAGDIPDFGVLRNVRQLVLREEMPRAKQRLSKDVVPEQTSGMISLWSLSEIQAQADASNQDLPFV